MFDKVIINEWMTTPVISVKPKTKILEATRIMKENQIRRLPVVDNNDKVVGILTIGDVREASPSDATSLSVWELNYLQDQITVDQIMTKDPIMVTADLPMLDAAELMFDHKVSGLPVIDKQTLKLVGIVTESDIFRMLVRSRVKQDS